MSQPSACTDTRTVLGVAFVSLTTASAFMAIGNLQGAAPGVSSFDLESLPIPTDDIEAMPAPDTMVPWGLAVPQMDSTDVWYDSQGQVVPAGEDWSMHGAAGAPLQYDVSATDGASPALGLPTAIPPTLTPGMQGAPIGDPLMIQAPPPPAPPSLPAPGAAPAPGMELPVLAPIPTTIGAPTVTPGNPATFPVPDPVALDTQEPEADVGFFGRVIRAVKSFFGF